MAKLTTLEGDSTPKANSFFQNVIKNDVFILGLSILAVYLIKRGKN